MQKLFLIAWSAVVVVCIGLMVLLYVSLIPHFADIGDWFVWLVRVGVVCACCLMVAFTWFKIQSMRHYSRFVKHGEVVSYIGPNKPVVVSAEHEQAKVPQLPQVTVKEVPGNDDAWDKVVDLRAKNTGLHKIADKTGIPYNQVRDFVNRMEGNSNAL